MAQIDTIVNVTVTKTSAAVSRAGFGTPLGVFQVPVAIQATRFATYSSVQAMIDVGFAADDSAVVWAGILFSQDLAPDLIAIGRRVEGTAQEDTVTITTADSGTWVVDINGTMFSFVGGAGDEQAIAVGLAAAINGGVPSDEPVIASTPIAGVFTVTAAIPGETFVNGGITVPGGGVGTFVNTVANVAAEAMATTLTAINTENAKDWYGFTIETRNDADITAAAVFAASASPAKIAIFQSRDPDAPAGTPGNIFDVIALTQNKKAALIFHDDETEYMDGAWLGRCIAADLDAVNGAITWHGKQLVGVPADDLTDAEITNIQSFNGNVDTIVGGRSFTQNGTSAEGEFIDVQTTIDWTQARVQEAVFARIATTPTKVPFTNAGIASISNEVLGVLNTGVGIGHYSTDQPPTVTAPTSLTVTEADKNARILRDVVGTAKLAGAIHSTIIQINVAA